MPAHYAHYRFGSLALHRFSPTLRAAVARHRELYDLGLQGPDLFFYHSYLRKTPVTELGYQLHSQPGSEFFTRCCDVLRRGLTEAGRVYLYGVLGHFCLDSICHPFVDAQVGISHYALETEFDRFLLELDGHDLGHQGTPVSISVSCQDIKLIHSFYPSVKVWDLRRSIRSMAFAQRLLSLPSVPLRGLVARVLGNSSYREMQLTEREDPCCSHLNGPMLTRFERALDCYPDCLRQLDSHLDHGAPLGSLFAGNFG